MHPIRVFSISLVLSAAACGGKQAPPVASNGTTGGPAAATAPAAIDPALQAVLAGSTRTQGERDRDGARHPAETLTFFGLRPDMHVVELWPGGGFYTAILGPYLRDRGSLAITVFSPEGDPKAERTIDALEIAKRIHAAPELAKVTLQQIAPPTFTLGADGSADLVVTFRNVHNWIPAGTAPDVFKAVARVLKPGGVFGVVDHRAAHDLTDKEIKDSGYVSEAQVIALAKAAGLVLDARSEINANARDTKDHPNGVWSLPPTYAGKDVDRDKFTAIGESDRMTLRFRKP